MEGFVVSTTTDYVIMSQKQELIAFAYDKRGKLLSVGRNSYIKSHPYQLRVARKSGNPAKIYLHAEVDALIKARGKAVHKLVVMRYGKGGKWLNAKPCPSCEIAIREFRVREVEHT